MTLDLFYISATHGLPWEMGLKILKDKSVDCDWSKFIDGMLKDGWNIVKGRDKVFNEIKDLYGKEYFEEFRWRFDKCLHGALK